MHAGFKAFTRPLTAAAFGLALLPGTALANGDVGAHVETYWNHMDEYAQGVERMKAALTDIAEQARNGAFDNADMDHLVDGVWEDVKVHGAIEVVATPLYPPIWEGIYDLRDAAESGAPADTVAAASRRTVIALHEGLGALKLAAYQHDINDQQQAGGGGEEAPIPAIGQRLDRAVAEYRDGHGDDAKALIHDAYFNYFEGIEGALIEKDAALVSGLEEDFNGKLPSLISDGASVENIRAQVDTMMEKLHKAEDLLAEAESEKGEVF